MPKKKKTQRNGMYWYMQELMPELRREGMTFPNGIADVVPVAAPRWKALPATERERYERKARQDRAKNQGNREADKYRFDNVGNIIADRKDAGEEVEQRRLKEGRITRSRWPKDDDALLDLPMYFISFEYFWSPEESKIPPPVEVGIVEFSLRQGIIKSFHKFIKPRGRDGKTIPLGFRFQCKSHSEERHQIPLDGFQLADDNFLGLLIQLENFVNKDGAKAEYPPVYALSRELKDVENSIEWLQYNACSGNPCRLTKLFELDSMAIDLFARKESVISRGAVGDLLYCSNYDYEPNTRCTFHEDEDTKYCALATVKKICYHLSDALTELYDFELTDKHLPAKKEPFFSPPPSRPPSAASSAASFNTRTDRYPRPAAPSAASSLNSSTRVSNKNAYSGFASRDIRYRDADVGGPDDLDDIEDPDEDEELGLTHSLREPQRQPPNLAWPALSEQRAPRKTIADVIRESAKPTLHDAVQQKPSLHDVVRQKPSLHDAVRQKKMMSEDPPKPSLHDAVRQKKMMSDDPPKPSLHDAVRQKKMSNEAANPSFAQAAQQNGRRESPPNEKPSLHDVVGRNAMAGVRTDTPKLAGAGRAPGRGRGVGRGFGRGSVDMARGVPVNAQLPLPGTTVGMSSSAGGGDAPPVDVSAAAPKLRQPMSQSNLLMMAAARKQTMGDAGRGRGILRPQEATKEGGPKIRPPPGFGRGLTIQFPES